MLFTRAYDFSFSVIRGRDLLLRLRSGRGRKDREKTYMPPLVLVRSALPLSPSLSLSLSLSLSALTCSPNVFAQILLHFDVRRRLHRGARRRHVRG